MDVDGSDSVSLPSVVPAVALPLGQALPLFLDGQDANQSIAMVTNDPSTLAGTQAEKSGPLDDDEFTFTSHALLDDSSSEGSGASRDEFDEGDDLADQALLDELLTLSTAPTTVGDVQEGQGESQVQQPQPVGLSERTEFQDLSGLLPRIPSFKFGRNDAKLLHIIKDNNLPPKLFDEIMAWARQAHLDKYDFQTRKCKTLPNEGHSATRRWRGFNLSVSSLCACHLR